MSVSSPPRLLRTTLATVAIAAATSLAACGSSSSPGASSPSATPALTGCATQSSAGDTNAALLAVPPAKVELTNPGTAPRESTTPTFDNTRVQRIVVASDDSADTLRDQLTMGLAVQLHCTDPTDAELTVTSLQTPDPDLAADLPAAVGSRAGVALAPGLAPVSLRIIPNTRASDAARGAVEQTLLKAFQRLPAVPTENLGVGATWTSTRAVNANVQLTQVISATMQSRSPEELHIAFDISETPENSIYTLANGQQLTIDQYTFAGKGTVTWDLRRGLPTALSITMKGGRVLRGADPAPIVQRTGYTLSFTAPT